MVPINYALFHSKMNFCSAKDNRESDLSKWGLYDPEMWFFFFFFSNHKKSLLVLLHLLPGNSLRAIPVTITIRQGLLYYINVLFSFCCARVFVKILLLNTKFFMMNWLKLCNHKKDQCKSFYIPTAFISTFLSTFLAKHSTKKIIIIIIHFYNNFSSKAQCKIQACLFLCPSALQRKILCLSRRGCEERYQQVRLFAGQLQMDQAQVQLW